MADAADLDLTNGMTLSGWVRPSATGGWRTVVLKEAPGFMAYALYSDTDTSRPSGHVVIGGADLDTRGAAAVAADAWTYLAATYDGANLRLYVNGALVATRAVTGSMAASASPLRIGGNGTWGEFFSGLIDDLRIYSRALSAAELQADQATPVP